MSVREEIAEYVIDGADEAKRLGRLQARRDWPRLPDAGETLAAAGHAYDRASRRVKRQVNRASFVAAFALAHLDELIGLDERPPQRRPRFHRGK